MTDRGDRTVRVLHVIRPGNLTGAPVAMLGILRELARLPRYRLEVVCGAAGDLTERLSEIGIPSRVCPHLTRDPSLGGDVERHVDRFLHVAAGLGNGLAHFAGHQLADLFLALQQHFGAAQDYFRALGLRRRLPGRECGLGGGDGLVHVFVGSLAKLCNQVAVAGVRAGQLVA
jgi:hypothetical protein